jgi:hypothetical protein
VHGNGFEKKKNVSNGHVHTTPLKAVTDPSTLLPSFDDSLTVSIPLSDPYILSTSNDSAPGEGMSTGSEKDSSG